MRNLIVFYVLFLLTPLGCAHAPVKDAPAEDAMTEQPAKPATDNPFFEEWKTPFGVPPFERIRDEHFVPAFDEAFRRHKAEIKAITDNPAPPTFDNTLVALDRSGALLEKVGLVFFGLYGADTNDARDAIAKQMAPRRSKHVDDILLDEKLYARIKAVWEQRDELELTEEQRTLLAETRLDFVQGGAELTAGEQAELRKINEHMASLKVQFGQNVLKEDNAFELVIDDQADLAGLPERVIQGAAKAAAERGHAGKWVFTLHKPSLIPFLQFSERRALRQKMLEGYIERGAHGDERDNRDILRQIVSLRTRRAKLLGYDTFAQLALSRRMAKTPAKVAELLDRLWKAALPVAKREAEALQKRIDADGGDFELEPWDWWYYAEKLRKAEYDLDENALRPYFELDHVLAGAFEVATRLYGLKFVERKDVTTYHPDVRTFEVREADGGLVGVLFVDYFPRASKRGGAWCGGFRNEVKIDGQRVIPLVTNVGNFSMPTEDKPSLLSFEEVSTLFHEFGHALNMLLLETTYGGTGDDIKVDFVELPSQIMENWAAEPQVLKLYAKHYQTGEPIPDELIAKIVRARHFNQGFETVEYLAAALLDMAWHNLTEVDPALDVEAFEKKALDAIGLIDEIVVRYRSPYFRHIFSSDFYAAGYYSYIWSAVLDADAFQAFKEKGLFDQATAKAFREHVLSKGGSVDPMVLYKRFRGREPEIEPLLERRGLLPAGK